MMFNQTPRCLAIILRSDQLQREAHALYDKVIQAQMPAEIVWTLAWLIGDIVAINNRIKDLDDQMEGTR